MESVPAVLALGLRVMEKGSSDARRWRFMLYVSTPFGTGLSYLDLERIVSLIGLKYSESRPHPSRHCSFNCTFISHCKTATIASSPYLLRLLGNSYDITHSAMSLPMHGVRWTIQLGF